MQKRGRSAPSVASPPRLLLGMHTQQDTTLANETSAPFHPTWPRCHPPHTGRRAARRRARPAPAALAALLCAALLAALLPPLADALPVTTCDMQQKCVKFKVKKIQSSACAWQVRQ